MPVSLPLISGMARPTALAAPVVDGRDDVDRGGASAFPVLLGGTVDGFLRRGVAVHGGHETFLDAEALFEEDVDDRREAVRRAAGIGNDVVLGRVVFVVVDAHDDGDVFLLGRRGDDDFLGSGVEVALGFVGGGEKAGALEDDVHAVLFPRQGGGAFLDGEAFDFLPVDHEHVVLGNGGRGFLAGHGAFEGALGGVVFEEISEVVGGHEVIDRDHLEVLAQQSLLRNRAENEAPDTPEAIDTYFSHVLFFLFWMCCGRNTY
jgi:hypothetical protein